MYGCGNIIKRYLEHYKISQTDLANRLGITQKHMNEILNNNADLSVDLMRSIISITNIDANVLFFVETKKKIYNELIEKYHTENGIKKYLESFYPNELAKNKWIRFKDINDNIQTAMDLLTFFKIRSFNNLDMFLNNKLIAFNKCDNSDKNKVFLWICRCDNIIFGQEINDYNSENFFDLLKELEKERMNKYNESKLIELFAKYGIYLVIEKPLEKTQIHGCTQVKGHNPAIYIAKTFKEKSEFYYNLYHELVHVKTDFNKAKNKIIINNEIESENLANIVALNWMINPIDWNQIINNLDNKEELCKKSNIPLSFLYSRLAYEKIIPKNCKEYLEHQEFI